MNEQPHRIFITEDELHYRNTTAELLRDEGTECVYADDTSAYDVIWPQVPRSFDS
ncbi:hypothetical protein Mal15_18990 [Stieleria maiorica]|uniref:Response regulatory domain-containing protein n=1 Tax=Stieleria maiorica TaxID=2795974 RepID=A0A5B9MAX1_9BACT|nr:hypothetical protein [Stieleria maiorica]QEF97853.1 hypothetical protein Mal15_18990 [Stieleria maiorica]